MEIDVKYGRINIETEFSWGILFKVAPYVVLIKCLSFLLIWSNATQFHCGETAFCVHKSQLQEGNTKNV